MKKAIIGSLILSILHSILFYEQDLGISVLLFMVVSVFLLMAFLKKQDKVKNANALYLSFPILLLSSTYFIFDNAFFYVVNLIVIPILLGSMVVWACSDTFKLREIIGKSVNLAIGSLEFIPGACGLIKNAVKIKPEEGKEAKEQKNKQLKLIGLGLLCSLPILFIIIGLLLSADGLFANLFDKLFYQIAFIFTSEFIANLIARIVLIVLIFIYLSCIIYNIVQKNSAFNREYKTKEFKLHVDHTIVNTILTMINIVYLIFTGIQFVYLYSYFFSNGTFSSNFSLAQYARQGFFELMFITVINFAIILFTNTNQKKEETKNSYTKWMNVLMCIFTIVIAISAFMRMRLYESEFGYTFLRLMVYVILITEMIAILPTIYYIIKGKINLLKSYFIIALTMYVIINFVNIDYQIAKNNIDRAEKGKLVHGLDINYLVSNLGTDAVPEMVYLYHHTTNEEDKRRINNYLCSIDKEVKKERSFQEWNLSKEKAKRELEPLQLEYQSKSTRKTTRSNNNI